MTKVFRMQKPAYHFILKSDYSIKCESLHISERETETEKERQRETDKERDRDGGGWVREKVCVHAKACISSISH